MEPKKTPKANLENKKFLFLQIGLITALTLMIISFEWSVTKNSSSDIITGGIIVPEDDQMPRTFQKEDLPEPPRPPDHFFVTDKPIDLPDDWDVPSIEDLPGLAIPLKPFPDRIEPADPGDDIFVAVEDMPTFQGKHYSYFRLWIYQHLRYPEKALINQIQGTVHISFVINKDGSVSGIEITRSVHPSLDNEIIRVVGLSPKWEPGKQWEKPVRVRFEFPVNFVIR
jgi:periplasmic protein TonB